MKFKNYHLRERHPEGFISTQPHKPRLEATETDSKSGIWIGSAGDNKFFKKEDYRFLYELFRELVEKGIEPLTDDLMHKDELAKLRAERDALVERANEQYLEQVKETAALRVGIGLLTTLAPDVDCGLPITELCSAVHNAVTAEIAALREQLAAEEKLHHREEWELACQIEPLRSDAAALRRRLRTYQRAVLWCYGWINHALAEELSPEEFASSIEDDRWNEVGALVGEATDEVDP